MATIIPPTSHAPLQCGFAMAPLRSEVYSLTPQNQDKSCDYDKQNTKRNPLPFPNPLIAKLLTGQAASASNIYDCGVRCHIRSVTTLIMLWDTQDICRSPEAKGTM